MIFKPRQDIDQFLNEPGMNSAIYDALLSVKEPAQFRYALKVPILDIFNEAYGQALRVLLDKHPEEDYYRNYQMNAKKYFQRSYEAELVFCVVYTLLYFSRVDTPNVKRFMQNLYRRFEHNAAYFPTFLKLIEDTYSSPFYDPDRDRVYLHTDAISKDELFSIRWDAATLSYNEAIIWEYLRAAPDLEYQLAIMKHIRESYEFNTVLNDNQLEDLNPLFDRTEKICKSHPKQPTPLPVIEVQYPKEEESDNEAPDVSTADIQNAALREQIGSLTEQIRNKDAEIQSLHSSLDNANKTIAEREETIQQLMNLNDKSVKLLNEMEQKYLNDSEIDPDDILDERTMTITTIVLVKILKAAGMGVETGGFDDTDAAKLISYFTKYSPNTIRKQVPKTKIPKTAAKEVSKVKQLLKASNLDISID